MSQVIWCPGMTLELLERQVIEKAYAYFSKNKTATAQALGISVRTLDNKFEKYEADKLIEQKRVEDERERRQAELARHRGIPSGVSRGPIPQASTFHDPSTGVRVESLANAASQQSVSVSERSQVQTVLPKQPSYGGSGKRRG